MHKQLLEVIVKIQNLAETCRDKKTFIQLQKVLRDLWKIYYNL